MCLGGGRAAACWALRKGVCPDTRLEAAAHSRTHARRILLSTGCNFGWTCLLQSAHGACMLLGHCTRARCMSAVASSKCRWLCLAI